MALHRKFDALLALAPDIAVISECAEPDRLRTSLKDQPLDGDVVWVGASPTKGLAVLTFNGYSATMAAGHDPTLQYVVPVRVVGPTNGDALMAFELIAVWAQNASAGIRRKNQPGPFRVALDRYHDILSSGRAVVAGDLNNNVIWDKPGWPLNQADAVAILERHDMVSAYHRATDEPQGDETTPTLYWRDRIKDGPTYHIDYVFVPNQWVPAIREFTVGSYEDWCGSGLSNHVPLVIDVQPPVATTPGPT